MHWRCLQFLQKVVATAPERLAALSGWAVGPKGIAFNEGDDWADRAIGLSCIGCRLIHHSITHIALRSKVPVDELISGG